MSENLPYADVIILALIAGFLVLRLRGILGQKIGHEAPPPMAGESRQEADAPVIALGRQSQAESQEEDQRIQAVEDPAARKELEAIREKHKDFSFVSFMEGARGAFEMAFDAFAKDNRDVLKMLLSSELFAQFSAELDARKDQESKPETTLVSILSQEVRAAVLAGSVARITLRFVSEQVTVLRDGGGKIVEGDPATPVHVEDVWTFERDLGSRSPNWKIIDT